MSESGQCHYCQPQYTLYSTVRTNDRRRANLIVHTFDVRVGPMLRYVSFQLFVRMIVYQSQLFLQMTEPDQFHLYIHLMSHIRSVESDINYICTACVIHHPTNTAAIDVY